MKSPRPWFMPLLVAEGIGILIMGLLHALPLGEDKWRWLLVDDAMISMAYAQSLAQGCGLVWYCGAEKVEGFTNFLWTLYMYLWHLVGIPKDYTALPILVTGLVTLGLHIVYLYRLGLKVGGESVGKGAAWLGATFIPLVRWHVSGLETGFLALILTMMLYLSLQENKQNRWYIVFLSALGVAIRMDFLLWALGIAFWLAWIEKNWKCLILSILIIGLVLGGLTIFRLSYYGVPFPQSYYAKVSNVAFSLRLLNGFIVLMKHFYRHLFLILLLIYGLKVFLRQIEYPKVLLIGLMMGVGVGYHLFSGGDSWEYGLTTSRFLLMGWMGGFIVAGAGWKLLRPWMRPFILGGIIMGMPTTGKGLEAFTGGKLLHRLFHPDTTDYRQRYHMGGWDDIVQVKVELARYLPPGAVIATTAAGSYPYFYPTYRWIDIIGLCSKHDQYDTVVCWGGAPMGSLFMPGHTRFGWERVLREADAIFGALIACETPFRKPKRGDWRCWLEPFPGCCAQSQLSGAYPSYARWQTLCTQFQPDPLLKGLYRKLPPPPKNN